MKVTIDSSTQTFVRFWLVPLGIVVAGYAAYSARSALVILASALFLALALNNPVTRLAAYMPGRSRIISTAIAFTLVVFLLGGFIFLAVPPIVQQTAKFAQTVPDLIDTAREQSRGLNRLIDQYNLQPQVDQATATIEANATRWASSVGTNLISGIGSLFAFMAAASLVLVLSFLMLIEGPSWMKRIWGLYHDKDKLDYHRTVVHKMHDVVSGYVTGQLAVSALGGIAAGLVVFILSAFFEIPSNLAIPTAVITFVLSLIPMFGATIGGILIALVLAFNDASAAIVYVVFFIVYQQIENNYISPVIQSKKLQLSALAVLASVTVGLYLFGIAGGIISIPIAGSIKVLIEAYLEKARIKRERSRKSPVKKLTEKATR